MNKTNNYTSQNPVMGWLITLGYVISYVLASFIGEIAFWISTILCISDKVNLKKQDKHIAWGWVLIPPVYLYKRAKLLNESLVKFWINLITMIIFVILSVYAAIHMTSCLSQSLPYFHNNQEIASQYCQCTMGGTPQECLQKLGM